MLERAKFFFYENVERTGAFQWARDIFERDAKTYSRSL